ncbi:MAG: hypothetical protein ABJN24_06535 [Hyphomicrobiales bacterium]
MEAIRIVLGIVAVGAAFAFWAGLIMLFKKKWRPKGKRILLLSILAMIIAPAIIISTDTGKEKQEQVALEVQAREAGFESVSEYREALSFNITSAEEWREKREELIAVRNARRKAEQKNAKEARTAALRGFPDEDTKRHAESLGIKRYEAYRLLNDEKAIARYCSHSVQANIFERDKNSQMDAVNTEAEKNEIWNKYEALQQKLIDNLNNDLGLEGFEFVEVSGKGHWDIHCRAAEQNWTVLTEAKAKVATRADANEVKEALQIFYQFNLEKQASPLFNKQRYDYAVCEWENHNDMRFVGCQLRSNRVRSNWQMFLVGRTESGRLAISPIDGGTIGNLNSTVARFKDQTFNNRIFIRGHGQSAAYIASYAGPRIDINAVRGRFR